MDLRKSVLRYLHSVFDTDPQAVWALRIAADIAFDWEIDALTLTLDNVALPLSQDKTLDMLADEARHAGYAAQVNPAVAHRTCAGLIDGAGNGTLAELALQDSVLWSISLPGALAQIHAQGAITEAVDQLNFMHADGGWLDLWGRYFDVPRQDGQTDAVYADFIKREILRTRANGLSIQVAVRDWTGHDIVIREPWRELFIWDKSRWDSGDTRWQDGNFFTFGTIQPRGAVPSDAWAAIMPVIQRNRALGCYVHDPVFYTQAKVLPVWPDVQPVVSFSWGNSMSAGIESGLSAQAGYGRQTMKYLGIAILSGASKWTGAWDTRTWQYGGIIRQAGCGYTTTT